MGNDKPSANVGKTKHAKGREEASPSVSNLRQVEQLVPSARNSRKHSVAQVDQIIASMKQFGFTIPVLIDEDEEIIAGHGRVMAASKVYQAGDTIQNIDGTPLPAGMVPVLIARGWSDAKKRAYIIADNKLAENAEWDETMLANELAALKLGGEIDPGVTGFSDDELDKMIASLGAPETPEEFPEVGEDIETEHQCPKCGYKWSGGA
jgi:hypothetical protein